MAEHNETTVERVSYRGRESVTHLLTADNLSIQRNEDGSRVLELFRYDERTNRAVESYRMVLCAEDVARLKADLRLT
jgi:hypothetical protein